MPGWGTTARSITTVSSARPTEAPAQATTAAHAAVTHAHTSTVDSHARSQEGFLGTPKVQRVPKKQSDDDAEQQAQAGAAVDETAAAPAPRALLSCLLPPIDWIDSID